MDWCKTGLIRDQQVVLLIQRRIPPLVENTVSFHIHMIASRITRSSFGLRKRVQSHRVQAVFRACNMATKTELAAVAPLEADELAPGDRPETLEGVKMSPVSVPQAFSTFSSNFKSPSVSM